MCFSQTLEELTGNYRTHSTDLAKTVSQYSQTQQEVRQIRYVCVSVCMYVSVWGFVSLVFLWIIILYVAINLL